MGLVVRDDGEGRSVAVSVVSIVGCFKIDFNGIISWGVCCFKQ